MIHYCFPLGLCLLLTPALPLEQTSQVNFGDLDKVIQEELKSTNTPGAAVAVISGERIILAKGFGVACVETGARVSPDMLFRLGSTTKMLTAATLVSLAQEGKLQLDQPIGNYVKGLSPKLARVTAHQLLSHTAGIREETTWYGLHDDSALANKVRSMSDNFCTMEPGKTYAYSSPGYWLAGFLIEELGGKPFADQMSDRLFQPLGMKRTTLRPTLAMTYPLAQGHQAVGNDAPTVVRPAADNAATWPAGSVYSSANDLARFVIAFLNGGTIDGKEVLPPAVIAKMSTAHVAIPESKDSYGYGLRIREERGVRVLEHNGNRLGYGSLIRMVPEHRFAVIILANKTGATFRRTADKALELLLPSKENSACAGEHREKREQVRVR